MTGKKTESITISIEGKLPGINEYTNECRRSPYTGSRMKKECEDTCIWSIRQQLRKVKTKLPLEYPVSISYEYHENRIKRDIDNISGFAHKVIQDALVTAGVLKDDSFAYIKGYSDRFYEDADKGSEWIDVTLEKAS